MSRDGKYFVFESVLSTHVEGDTDEKNDIFLLDIASGDISLISTGLSVSYYAPTISSTGKYITYYGGAKSSYDSSIYVGPVYVFNVETGVTIELDSAIPVGSIIKKSGLDISTDGKYVLSDHSHLGEFSLINTEEQSETLLSYSFSLSGSESKLSADGRFVLFQKGHHISYAPLHIYDTKTAQTTVLSVATNGSNEPTRVSMGNFAVSGDGRYITFVSREGALYGEVPVWGSYGKPEVIVYDRVAHQAATVNEG